MRRTLAALFLVVLFAQPACAKQASLQDRLRLSQTVANYINDPYLKGYKDFNGARAVEIGAAVVEGNGALADWRSVDRKHHGQIAFYFMCDGWNVLRVSNELPLKLTQIVTSRGITSSSASLLIAQLGALESKHVAYLKPPHAQMSC